MSQIDKLFIRIITGTRYVDLYRYCILDDLLTKGGNTLEGFAVSLDIPFASVRFVLDDWHCKGILKCTKFMDNGHLVKYYVLNPDFYSGKVVDFALFDAVVGDKRTLRSVD